MAAAAVARRGLGSTASSLGLGGGTRMLARMLASAPMIPTPANMTNTPVSRPSGVTGNGRRSRRS